MTPVFHKTPHGGMYVWGELLQSSEEWLNLRRGFPTASMFSKIITPKTCEVSKQAVDYMDSLVEDCIETGRPPSFIGNADTDHGTEFEPEARAAFAEETGLEVVQVGFVARQDKLAGCSPDGLVVDPIKYDFSTAEGLELKCPRASGKHTGYVRVGRCPDKYLPQVHGSLAITGLKRWHFFSYVRGTRPFHFVVERDAYTDKLAAALDEFIKDYVRMKPPLLEKLRIAA